jgi:hypothetical protein
LFNEENRDLLDKVALTFFSDIAEIMHRDWILQAYKLMDPAKSDVKGDTLALENITIKLINEQLKTNELSNKTINDVSEKIFEYGTKIKLARNKRLAHFDREHQVNNITLGETTEQELFEFLDNIQNYCDEVGVAIDIGPLDFSGSGCKGDALDLIKYLRGGR